MTEHTSRIPASLPTAASRRVAGAVHAVHRETILPLAWGPAILLQLAHPLVARGIADHSTFRSARFGRLRRFHRTLDAMLRLSFGSEREVRAAAGRIRATHDRVHGRLPEAAGAFRAGTAYSAHDSALLAWVHATVLDSQLRVHELYLAPLPPATKDRYCDEAGAFGERLGIAARDLPRTFADLRRYVDGMLASDAIAITDVARDLAREVVPQPPHPLLSPVKGVLGLTTLALLPPSIRDAFGYRWEARDEARLEATVRFVRGLLRVAPSVLRHWPAARRTAPGRCARC